MFSRRLIMAQPVRFRSFIALGQQQQGTTSSHLATTALAAFSRIAMSLDQNAIAACPDALGAILWRRFCTIASKTTNNGDIWTGCPFGHGCDSSPHSSRPPPSLNVWTMSGRRAVFRVLACLDAYGSTLKPRRGPLSSMSSRCVRTR